MKYIAIAKFDPKFGNTLKQSDLSSKPLTYIFQKYKEGKASELGLSQDAAQLLTDHTMYQQGLKERGRLIAGGPARDFTTGFMIFEAGDIDEAKSLLENDPLYLKGAYSRDYSIFEWFQAL